MAVFRIVAALLLTIGAAPDFGAWAQTQDELARMKSEYRRPPPLPVPNRALAELGRELFFEPQISASGKTACAPPATTPNSAGAYSSRAAVTIPAN
jgi:cytochrome c peroxidase